MLFIFHFLYFLFFLFSLPSTLKCQNNRKACKSLEPSASRHASFVTAWRRSAPAGQGFQTFVTWRWNTCDHMTDINKSQIRILKSSVWSVVYPPKRLFEKIVLLWLRYCMSKRRRNNAFSYYLPLWGHAVILPCPCLPGTAALRFPVAAPCSFLFWIQTDCRPSAWCHCHCWTKVLLITLPPQPTVIY